MPQTTEAACLLQTGGLYTRRVGLEAPDGGLIFAGIKRGAFSVYFGDEPIYHFDLEGRWQRVFLGGIHYRKALDNRVDAIDRVREGENLVLRRRALTFAEVADLDASVRAVAIDLIDRLVGGGLRAIDPPSGVDRLTDGDLREVLDRIAGWDASAWFSHRERYLSCYAPLGFLPPDAHQAIVLQATIGDARRPAFGGREPREHAVRTAPEFLSHARGVAKLLGRRALQAGGVFLGGGDLLSLPVDEVSAYLDASGEVFPLRASSGPTRLRDRAEDAPSLGGVDVFLDVLTHQLPPEAWARWKAKGLRRVNLGIESGAPEIRSRYGSEASDDEILGAVAGAKAAGLALGLVVLGDAGGRALADRHEEATAALLNRLPLSRGDLIYLTEAEEVSGGRMPEGLEPAPSGDRVGLAARWKAALEGARARGAKVAPYSLEKAWN